MGCRVGAENCPHLSGTQRGERFGEGVEGLDLHRFQAIGDLLGVDLADQIVGEPGNLGPNGMAGKVLIAGDAERIVLLDHDGQRVDDIGHHAHHDRALCGVVHTGVDHVPALIGQAGDLHFEADIAVVRLQA